MKETIEFKKEIILKSSVSEMVEVNLTHEYKIMDDVIEGDFHVSGEYKITEASVQLEEFYYKIPFAIALSDRIKRESVNLVIDDFNYEVNKDVLLLKMKLGMNYEEVIEEVRDADEDEIEAIDAIDEVLNEVEEERMIEEESELEDESKLEEERKFEEEIEETNKTEEEIETEVQIEEEKEELKEEIESIVQKFNMPDNYVTYKIHIAKSEETLETIALKYDVTIDSLREYNDIEVISIGDKILVPLTINE